ncbi:MAG: hypothetical protein PVF95_00685 [bacterium]|jgi:hypothetical protein
MRNPDLRILGILVIAAFPSACWSSSFSAANIGMLPGAAPTQAYVSEVPELNDFWWNPAGLGYLDRVEVAGGYMDYLTSLKGGLAGFGAPTGRGWSYDVYISYLSTGQVTRTDFNDPTGGEGETFTFGELMGGFAAGMRLHDRLSAGAGLKFAREQLDADFRTGVLADVGGAFRLYGGGARGLSAYVSAVGRNMIIAQDGDGGGSPAGLEAGFSLAGSGGTPFSGGVSYYIGQRGVREVRSGVIGLISEDFRVRAGYRRRVGENSDSQAGFSWLRGLTAGFGVRFGKFWLDYTYEDSSPLDAIHRFGVTFTGTSPN